MDKTVYITPLVIESVASHPDGISRHLSQENICFHCYGNRHGSEQETPALQEVRAFQVLCTGFVPRLKHPSMSI